MERVVRRNWEGFQGLDYRSTILTRDKRSAVYLTNYRFGRGKSLRGRNGNQVLAMPGNFTGIGTYSRTDASSGETLQSLCAMNQYFWELQEYQFRLIRNSGSTVSVGANVFLDYSTGRFKFTIAQNDIVYPEIDLGTGLEGSDATTGAFTGVTVYDMLQQVATVTGGVFTVDPTSYFQSAKVPTAQSGITTMTVAAGHTIAAGDLVQFWNSGGEWDGELQPRLVVGTTATTLSFSSYEAWAVAAGEVVGPLSARAAGIPAGFSPSSLGGNQIVVSYYAWRPVNFDGRGFSATEYYYHAPFQNVPNVQANFNQKAQLPTFINANNCLYIFYPDYSVTNPAYGDSPSSNGRIFKYDGRSVYQAGMPVLTVTALNEVASATGPTVGANYSYLFISEHRDNQANQIFSSELEFPVGARVTAPNRQQNFTASLEVKTTLQQRTKWDGRGAIKNTTEGPTNTLKVDLYNARPGDTLNFLDSSGALQARTINSINYGVTPVTVTISGTAVTVNSGSHMSTGGFLNMYRTLANGNAYYFLQRVPITAGAPITLGDNKNDSALTFQYIRSRSGRERNMPPRASFGCLHQGLLVAAGDSVNPNTVYKSLVNGGDVGQFDSIENFSIATGSFDVPGNITGAITAIASDTDDRLAVFKPNCYYDVVGDLDTNGFSTLSVREGDYGISSQSSVAKVNGVIVGVGKLGVIGVRGGELTNQVGYRVNPRIASFNPGADRLDVVWLTQASAVNDYLSHSYRLFLPYLGEISGADTLTELQAPVSFGLTMDYENKAEDGSNIWFDAKWNYGMMPDRGFAIWNDRVHFLSGQQRDAYSGSTVTNFGRRGNVFREIELDEDRQAAQDSHLPIRSVIQMTPDDMDRTWAWKQARQLVLYSVRSELGDLYELFQSMFITVEAWNDPVMRKRSGSAFKLLSQAANFPVATEIYKVFNLAATKSQWLTLYIESNSYGSSPFITGYDLILNEAAGADEEVGR